MTSKIVDVFRSICDACSLETEIPETCTPDILSETLIESINPTLEPLDLSVGISSNYSVSDDKFLVMYSTSAFTKSSKLFIFSDHEQKLFQAWIKTMFVDNPFKERGELDGTTAINVGTENDIRASQAEAFLNKLLKDNIFRKLNDFNSYIFTPRAVMELQPRLRATEYDVPSCPICSNLVITRRFSHHCFICNTLIHSTCLQKMITLSTNVVACPGKINENIRCTNKYDLETLESLVFDTPASENINRPVEIVGVRGGTLVPDSDQEMGEQDDNDSQEAILKGESNYEADEENRETINNVELERSDEEDDEEEETAEEEIVKDEENDISESINNQIEEDYEEPEEEDDEEELEGDNNEEQNQEQLLALNKDHEDNSEKGIEELEERFADHNFEASNPVKTSSIQKQPVQKKNELNIGKKRKSGDALDDLFDEIEDEENEGEDEEEGEEGEEYDEDYDEE
uniref:Phorbol-ester/DAG-type domain-containing protein n=1 Tax=Panagrolaimus sp. ES5 TaxID=591445 RepID=A0AC34F0F0_9BILA